MAESKGLNPPAASRFEHNIVQAPRTPGSTTRKLHSMQVIVYPVAAAQFKSNIQYEQAASFAKLFQIVPFRSSANDACFR